MTVVYPAISMPVSPVPDVRSESSVESTLLAPSESVSAPAVGVPVDSPLLEDDTGRVNEKSAAGIENHCWFEGDWRPVNLTKYATDTARLLGKILYTAIPPLSEKFL